MKLCKKTNKMKGFWVEDYTEQEKEFFIGLGFTERRVKFMDEWMNGSLSFHGSRSFGFWNDEEAKTIYDAVAKEFGKCEPRILTTAELM